jgi:hypothetical protein
MSGPSDDEKVAEASGALPKPVLRRIQAYMAALDRDLPGALSGLYVVGSVALGDYTPKFSDIDLVVVADGRWTLAQIDVARKAHRHLNRRRHPARVAYVGFDALAAGPRPDEVLCFRGMDPLPPEDLANSFTWHILAAGAIALRGPRHPAVRSNDAELEAWAEQQLHDHWGPWLESVQHRPGSLLFKRSVAGPVLEVTRLYGAATTGKVLSKLDAGEAVAPQVGQKHARILWDATGYRQGYHTSMYWGPFERKHDALDLIEQLTSRSSV